MRGVHRFVEDLLRRRRTRPFQAGPDDVDAVRTAILLRSAAPGEDQPTDEFVERLHQRLQTELAEPTDDGVTPRPETRRRFLQVASVAATAAAVGAAAGAGADHAIVARKEPNGPAAGSGEETLTPNAGVWRTVTTSADLPDGTVREFELDSVAGFVTRAGGRLTAVSGVCTHLGCRLVLDSAARTLDCPCHRAAFAVTGAVLRHQLPIALRPLPRLMVREVGDAVQVFAPTTT